MVSLSRLIEYLVGHDGYEIVFHEMCVPTQK